MASLMEELEKGLKEVRGFAAPFREQQCQPAIPSGAPRDGTTNQRIHMEGRMVLVSHVTYMMALLDISGRGPWA